MGKFKVRFKPFSNKGILMEWPSVVDTSILDDVICTKQVFEKVFPNTELVPAYNSLVIIFSDLINVDDTVKEMKMVYKEVVAVSQSTKMLWKIPVCYEEDFGIDLQIFSKDKALSSQEVISLHTDTVYTVFCIGFLPGFLYLGGLDKRLHHPRRSEPRLKIPRGSVGIGGEQTGIYPQESPGGWNIIGNSPVKIFDVKQKNPCPVSVGDKIQFYAISKALHDLVSVQVDAGVFKLEGKKI